MTGELEKMFKPDDKVKTERNVYGTVIGYVDIQGKQYIRVRWKNGTYGIYGVEEVKRYNIKKVT